MHFLAFSLLSGALLTAIVSAKPVYRFQHNQELLTPELNDRLHRTPAPRPLPAHADFDAMTDSVGVLFTEDVGGEEGSVEHLWLPLGKTIFTRDHPVLPLHPTTARITSLINSSPDRASTEVLDRLRCDIWTYPNMTARRGKERTRWRVTFSRADDVVHFEEEAGGFWLGDKEMESIRCS